MATAPEFVAHHLPQRSQNTHPFDDMSGFFSERESHGRTKIEDDHHLQTGRQIVSFGGSIFRHLDHVKVAQHFREAPVYVVLLSNIGHRVA